MNQAPEIGALVLAAGRSRRFGGDKRRARLGDGRSLLETTVSRYVAIAAAVRVVMRPEDDAAALMAAPFPNVEIIRATDADRGMAHSLAAGLSECTWDAALVVLADMPCIAPATLREIVETWSSASDRASTIVRPSRAGAPGHPVCFGRDHFPALRDIEGDRGARDYLRGEHVVTVDVDDAGTLVDVDTREALDALPTPEIEDAEAEAGAGAGAAP
jgi:molybdenum cofactor cytidylyltransferase